jgi:6-phosphofructokinase 1
MGVPVMCLPGTIDNDLPHTEYSIGFDSAVNCAIWEIERIKDTMLSHERIAVVEVMGNQCGDIALYAGISSEAAFILVPEVKYDLNKICEKLLQKKMTGEDSNIIVMAEGAGDINKIAMHLSDHTKLEIRTNVLGYVQRGGGPTAFDRMLSFRMCMKAFELIKTEQWNKAIGIRNNEIIGFDISDALKIKKRLDEGLYLAYQAVNEG